MRVQVRVTLDVESIGGDVRYMRKEIEQAAAEAVENALKLVESNGFSHVLRENLSVRFVDAVSYEVDGSAGEVRCPACGLGWELTQEEIAEGCPECGGPLIRLRTHEEFRGSLEEE